MSNPFMTTSDASARTDSMALAPMGTRTKSGRYKMPLLPEDQAPKSALGLPLEQRWVSGGLQSMTNLAGSISDTRALGTWETQQGFIGLGLNEDLHRDLQLLVRAARAAGVDFQSLREHREFRDELNVLIERAKDIAGANKARDAGNAAHDEWEMRGSGVSAVYEESFTALEQLLDAADFERVPDLRERVVRNVRLAAAGRFDDILLHRRTGKLHIADLKTKRKPFWTFLEIDAQLAGYAFSEWMLEMVETSPGVWEMASYVPGPLHHVDLTEGVVLHMPSDGSEPRLRRADLLAGWETMKLARRVCDLRSYGRSADRMSESWWPV